MFHAFPSPPPPQPQPPFRSFFQDPIPLLPRGYYHVQHPPFPHPLQSYRPAPSPPPPPPQPAVRLIAIQPPRTSALPPAQHQVHSTDSVHHVHVFYYYYVPADLAQETSRTGRRDDGNDQGPRKPCTDHPESTTTACPPSYIPPPPPPSPSPLPPPPPPAPIATPTTPPPPPSSPTEPPCDDTVVVDAAEYYPYSGRAAPIVVAAEYQTGAARDVNGYGPRDIGRTDRQPNDRRPEHRSNFILANYLLPPDNK